MNNNDVLRRIRYALNLNDNKLLKILDMGGNPIKREDIPTLMSKEDDQNYAETPDTVLNAFLDGLITYKRGAKDEK
ncbi:DUF1456 family protein [Seleniivibrio woodruffii]|uniref:DUF1456 family protein n=1 Tax=Seleniivibrio woodruffii TaxID=1078050 RepID=UPI00104DCB46|nr:DUF1456 family protein [Seleniivibrio woodruffii]TVZ35586.1 uncharacterized protein DUF1456 [Seleniivibrio woodruffii]